MTEPSRAQAAAEVAALLASPPPWLDLDGPHDTELAPLEHQQQRGRGPPATKLAWRWTCAIRAPEGSPYAVGSYRVLVRFPMGYPLLPPRLHVLSVLHHIEVDLRDPFEGQLDDLYYEKLAERASRAEAASRVDSRAEAAGAAEAGAAPEAGEAETEAEATAEAPPAKRARLDAAASQEAEADAALTDVLGLGSAAAASASHAGAVEPSWMAPEPRFSLRDALELFEAMLRGPLEEEPTAQVRPSPSLALAPSPSADSGPSSEPSPSPSPSP